MRLFSLLALTFAVFLGVSFAVLNSNLVVVHYFLGTRELPLSILILGIWVFGIVFGLCFSTLTIFKLKRQLKQARREKA